MHLWFLLCGAVPIELVVDHAGHFLDIKAIAKKVADFEGYLARRL